MTHAMLLGLVIGTVSPNPHGVDSLTIACDSARLAAVAFLRGEWQVRSHEPTLRPVRERNGTAGVTVVAGGCALREDLRLGEDYEETRLLAFDDRGGAWQLVIVDSEHGNMLTLRGHAVENGLDFISTHQRPDGLLIDRVAIRQTATGWLMRTETASGYGAPWEVLQEIRYAGAR